MNESNGNGSSGVLTALRRNRFPYGKLMETRHWELEQWYGIQARRLVNRLGLGAGVLCGLGLRIEDGVVLVEPGVAVDALGREIVVTETVRLEKVDQPTDDGARPAGEPVENGPVTIWLCYRECGSELVRLPAGDCGQRDACMPGLTDERFGLRIGAGAPGDYPGLSKYDCGRIFPGPADPRQRRGIVAGLMGRCSEPPADPCVPLGVVTLDGHAPASVDLDHRTTLLSNEELFDLVLCLAARVDDCCRPATPTHPPRLVATWPPLGALLRPADWSKFLDQRRLEMVIERPMRALGLDQPDGWLGVWRVDAKGAQRVPIARTGGDFEHVTPGPGQQGVAYQLAPPQEPPGDETAFVVMASVRPGGDIVASDNAQALDVDLRGTGLSDADRGQMWGLEPGHSWSSGSVRGHVSLPAAPSLPSGNGVEGGELHGWFARRSGELELPPQLLAVWPYGGQHLSVGSADHDAFFYNPRVELTLSRPLADSAWQDAWSWLHVLRTVRDASGSGAINFLSAVPLTFDGRVDDPVLPSPPGSVTYSVKLDRVQIGGAGDPGLVVAIRPGGASTASQPVGAEAPALLLDADFLGTALSTQLLMHIWPWDQHTGGWMAPIPSLGAVSTLGQVLHDGSPGGLFHSAFVLS